MKLYLSILSILLVFMTSCSDENIVFEENVELENQSWSRDDVKTFEFDNTDTLEHLDFFFNLRTTTSYPYSNLYLFVELEAPSQGDEPGLVSYDTINIPLADLTGQWKGKVSGSMVENNVFFMNKVRLTDIGAFKLTFQQGMRDADLNEIVDVGLKISKSKD